ncbi:MAG: diacylglycerol kinase family protein, partial [Paracoccaceae bacterium]
MSTPIGHIRNPSATQGAKAALAPHPRVMTRTPADFEGLDAALAEMRAAGVSTIIIEGGDGTVREVISRAIPLWAGAAPDFAILAAGNTNLVARKAGRIDAEGAARLIAGAATARRRDVALLKLERQSLPTLRGFIMGAGAYAAATRLAQRDIGARHGAQVAQTVLRLLSSSEMRAPSQIGFAAGGGAPAPPPPP